MNFRDIVPDDLPTLVMSRFAQLQHGFVLAEGRPACKDGGIVPVELNTPAAAGRNLYGTCHNIADRKAAENELRQRNAELEAFNQAAGARDRQRSNSSNGSMTCAGNSGREPPYRLDFMDETVDHPRAMVSMKLRFAIPFRDAGAPGWPGWSPACRHGTGETAMEHPLKVLIIEGVVTDFLLVERYLRLHGPRPSAGTSPATEELAALTASGIWSCPTTACRAWIFRDPATDQGVPPICR
jgi:hypothetical protein